MTTATLSTSSALVMHAPLLQAEATAPCLTILDRYRAWSLHSSRRVVKLLVRWLLKCQHQLRMSHEPVFLEHVSTTSALQGGSLSLTPSRREVVYQLS